MLVLEQPSSVCGLHHDRHRLAPSATRGRQVRFAQLIEIALKMTPVEGAGTGKAITV
jgi:hypothetical protein